MGVLSAVARRRINTSVLDPWRKVERSEDASETMVKGEAPPRGIDKILFALTWTLALVEEISAIFLEVAKG